MSLQHGEVRTLVRRPRAAMEMLEPRNLLSAYHLIDLGVGMSPAAVNDAGLVVGSRYIDDKDGTRTVQAFAWTPGVGAQSLGTLGGANSKATAANNAGVIVGEADGADGLPHAFVWSATTGMQDLGTAVGEPRWIGDNGEILASRTVDGQAYLSLFVDGRWMSANVDTKDTVYWTGRVSRGGSIVGNRMGGVSIGRHERPEATLHFLEGGAANDVGGVARSEPGVLVVRYEDGISQAFEGNGGRKPDPFDLNANGTVVGQLTARSPSKSEAFITDGQVIRTLASLLPEDAFMWIRVATDLSDSGIIVGLSGFHADRGFVMLPDEGVQAPPHAPFGEHLITPDEDATECGDAIDEEVVEDPDCDEEGVEEDESSDGSEEPDDEIALSTNTVPIVTRPDGLDEELIASEDHLGVELGRSVQSLLS